MEEGYMEEPKEKGDLFFLLGWSGIMMDWVSTDWGQQSSNHLTGKDDC